MAKTKTPAKPKMKLAEPTEVEVTYDLFDLPTAFHKAGLAGLVMLITSLKERRLLNKENVKCELTPTCATVTFTKSLIQHLMDDLYDARIVEVAVRSKWQGATVKREETVEENKDGKVTQTKRFIYDVVQPSGQFLRDRYPDEDGLWLKLWRDMMWSIPRGRPTTREPYNQRANGQACKEGPNVWADLLKVQKARMKNAFHTAEISSALLPGAQAQNAEGVPFEGRAEHNILLHYWPLAVRLFVPHQVDTDGSTEFVGFTLAVPEVSDLEQFIHDYPNMLNGLTKNACGYRPAESVIDLAAEGALAFLNSLAVISGQHVEKGELRHSIRSVEYLHLVKIGNNVKTMASGRVSPNKNLLAEYRQVVAPKDESTRYRNPLFRRALLIALLDDDPCWYRAMGRILATFDAEVFIRQPRHSADADENGPPQFANDVAKKFRNVSTLFANNPERKEGMSDALAKPVPPPVIINRVVRKYLIAKTEEKPGLSLKKYRDEKESIAWDDIPKELLDEFNKAKQKLAQSLFLEFRSRKEQAFVDHFAATFFSVTQRLAEADRLELAEMLVMDFERRDDLKTLTLLSLSANS